MMTLFFGVLEERLSKSQSAILAGPLSTGSPTYHVPLSLGCQVTCVLGLVPESTTTNLD